MVQPEHADWRVSRSRIAPDAPNRRNARANFPIRAMPERAGRVVRRASRRNAPRGRALLRRIRSEMRVLAVRFWRWHRDCDATWARTERPRHCDRTVPQLRHQRLCSLSFSCLAVCGLIPLSRAKELHGHAHGWYGERSVGPWNRRRHSHRALLARPHTGAHEIRRPHVIDVRAVVCSRAALRDRECPDCAAALAPRRRPARS